MLSNVFSFYFESTVDAVSVDGAIQYEITIEWLSTRKRPFSINDARYSDLPLNLSFRFISILFSLPPNVSHSTFVCYSKEN